jgi:hypothetical protein
VWPGRRWQGQVGTVEALRQCEAVQLDPLNVAGRSHDLTLLSRVVGYRAEFMDQVVYQERRFFDYGGCLFLYPVEELPYWRLHMQRRAQQPRWSAFAADSPALLDQVRAELRARGPLGNRDFDGNARVNSYRGRKDTSLALYYLWLTGEVMIHHRQRFEKFYNLAERVAPPEVQRTASPEEAEAYFARKAVAFLGLITELGWKNTVADYLQQPMGRAEAQARLADLVAQGVLTPLRVVEDSSQSTNARNRRSANDVRYALSSDLPLLEALESGQIPAAWRPCAGTTLDEAVFLAPLDIVSARGRAGWLFGFDYVWEVYKPAHQRRWGYYTLPILYGDRLAARLDPKLDRPTATLHINGFWLEDHTPADDPAFATALGCGLARLAEFNAARKVNATAIVSDVLREHVEACLRERFDVESSVS